MVPVILCLFQPSSEAVGQRPACCYWANIAVMEKKVETTVVCWGYMGKNGKEHGNY